MSREQSYDHRQLTAGVDDNGRRIDRVVRRAVPQLGLSQLHRALRVGEIRRNGKRCRASDRVENGDIITVRLPRSAGSAIDTAAVTRHPAPETLIEGRIILENEHILALHKRRGTLVHGDGSLNDAVTRYLSDRLKPSLSFRPGPLHRLDRNSSGLILFGKSLQGAQRFSELLQQRQVAKSYLGLFAGAIRQPCCWSGSIQRNQRTLRSHSGSSGYSAETVVQPLALGRYDDGQVLTLAICRIRSGRTHQIRAHAAHAGFPLAGDSKYGGGSFLGGYILHALSIELERVDPLLGFRRLVDPPENSVQQRIERFFGRSALHAVVQEQPKRLHYGP
ncbi:MAG: RluA family pseudouridine synthase [Spirochaetaceae bacterium]|nr:MAG: RluA family pseudouridine synthase [Spirochaetaceae bacterium]